MRSRLLHRVTALVTGALLPLVVAVPAFAVSDDGEPKGSSLGVGMTIVIYVVVPVAIFTLIAGLALLPSTLRKPRYRPGRGWKFAPLWFGGPDDPDAALAEARAGATAKGGARADW